MLCLLILRSVRHLKQLNVNIRARPSNARRIMRRIDGKNREESEGEEDDDNERG